MKEEDADVISALGEGGTKASWQSSAGNPGLQSLLQDVRRVTPYPPPEVSDARRYQTRGEADRVQGRTWEGGKGEEDR